MPALLEIEHEVKRFGGLLANNDVSFTLQEGEILGLIGPNGAGKTTLFNCISGYMHPDEGTIRLAGRDVSRMRPEFLCKLGVARTWQIVRTFQRLSVLDNVICGAFNRTNSAATARRTALEMLEFTGLADRAHVLAAHLTLADKKRLEIARALATGPRLLLLDEAMSGLTPTETAAAVDLVRRAHRAFNLTLCVVEHVMEVVMPLSDRIVVLDYGVKIAEGPPAQVANDEAVIKAYLGERFRARQAEVGLRPLSEDRR